MGFYSSYPLYHWLCYLSYSIEVIMTVGELREKLKDVDDEVPVMILFQETRSEVDYAELDYDPQQFLLLMLD